jgi:hypothetical protein
MRQAVVAFFDADEAWLEETLEQGRRQSVLAFRDPARNVARMIASALQGAVLVARPSRTPTTSAPLLSG